MIKRFRIVTLLNLQKNWRCEERTGKRWVIIHLFLVLILSWNGVGLCASFSDIIEAFEQDFNRLNPEKIKDHFISLVEELSGMRIDKSIPIEYKPRGDAKNEWFMMEMERNSLNDEIMIQGYEYILKRFDLLDPDKSLRETLMTYYDDIHGLYDPSKKSMIFFEGINREAISTTLFHELLHAAQDSTVDLIKFQEKYCNTLDSALAASALIEGQATALQFIVQIEKNLEGKTRKEIIEDMIEKLGDDGVRPFWANDSDVFSTLRTFPYSFGLIFVLQRIVKDGSDFPGMFEKVPVSTEQILHIDKFEKNEHPVETFLGKNIKKISSLDDITPILNTSLGEYYISQIFNNVLNKDTDVIEKSTSGWGGDRIMVMKAGGTLFFIWDTMWDTGEDAEEFYQEYLIFSKNRFKVNMLAPNKTFYIHYNKDDSIVLIKRQGKRVIIIEGQIAPEVLEKMKKILDI